MFEQNYKVPGTEAAERGADIVRPSTARTSSVSNGSDQVLEADLAARLEARRPAAKDAAE